jgi:hypothetical protein
MLDSLKVEFENCRSHLTPDASRILHAFASALAAELTRAKTQIELATLAKAVARAIPTFTGAECEALAVYSACELIVSASAHSDKSVVAAPPSAMQETQMSFNLQYLQLQMQMQHENRAFTAVSNIMKTKHDTVKNSISNIR